MNIKSVVLSGAMGLIAFATTVTAEEGVTDSEIVIGNVLPIATPIAVTSVAAHLGTVIAAAEANNAGGVNGRKIVIQTEDDGYVPARTVQGLRKLMDDGVFAMIGTGSGAGTAAVLPILEEEAIPTIVAYSPLRAAIDPIKPSIFMIGASYQDLVFAQLEYIYNNTLPENPVMGIIRQDDDFGVQVEEAYDRAIEAFGIEAITPITYKRGQKDFSAEILKVRAAGVNILVSGGAATETPAMLKAASRYQMPLQLVSVPTSMLGPIMGLGASSGYTYFSGDYISPLGSEGTAAFEKLAQEVLSEDDLEDVNRYTLSAYVATRMMIEAIDMCGVELTRACVSEKLASGHVFENGGITPPLSFSADSHIAATAVRVMKVDPATAVITPVTEFTQY